jgi:hypothetical protein
MSSFSFTWKYISSKPESIWVPFLFTWTRHYGKCQIRKTKFGKNKQVESKPVFINLKFNIQHWFYNCFTWIFILCWIERLNHQIQHVITIYKQEWLDSYLIWRLRQRLLSKSDLLFSDWVSLPPMVFTVFRFDESGV